MVLIIVTPEQLELTGARELSERIIQSLMVPEIVDIVGIGSGISGVVAAVNLSSLIANVNIQSVSLDYIPISVLGKQEAIFFELSREKALVPPIISDFEKQSDEIKRFQTIWVSRRDQISSITNLILWRLNQQPMTKIVASGFAILTAVRSVLQVTTSEISREPVGISSVTVESIERRGTSDLSGVVGKMVPAIQIYLKKGQKTVYSPRHGDIIKRVIEKG